jgi:fatty acid desaturase
MGSSGSSFDFQPEIWACRNGDKRNIPMKSTQYNELNGRDAIKRRDALENFITVRFPMGFQHWASAALTSITGLAPSSRAGRPVWAGSELRATIYMLATLAVGALLVLMNTPGWVKAIGVLAVVSATRSLSSAVGHQLTHSSKGLPWRAELVRIGYDVVGALLVLPSYALYQWLHGIHHGKVGGPGDPDQELLDYLKARTAGFWPLVGALLNPGLHARFLAARLRAVFGKLPEGLSKSRGDLTRVYDPAWRRALAAMGLAAGLLLPFSHIAAWLLGLVLGYQVASLLSAISLHL